MAPDAKAESKSNNLSFWWGITPNLEMRLKQQQQKKDTYLIIGEHTGRSVCLSVG